jgi:hypothetical protein
MARTLERGDILILAGTTCTSSRISRPHSREQISFMILSDSADRFPPNATIVYVVIVMLLTVAICVRRSRENEVGCDRQRRGHTIRSSRRYTNSWAYEKEREREYFILCIGGEARDELVVDVRPQFKLVPPLLHGHASPSIRGYNVPKTRDELAR